MKKIYILFVFLIPFTVYCQENQEISTAKVEETTKILDVKNIYGYWQNYDNEQKILKIKGEDGSIYEFKCDKNFVRLFGRSKGIKFKDFSEGDFVQVYYRESEGEKVVTRIIKDPPRRKEVTPSQPGN